jgi:hypothetical protein
LIGGLPLLQALSITFTGAPIPFGKIGFPPKQLQDIIDKIKQDIKNGKSFLNGLKNEFKLPADIQKALEEADANIKKFTENNYQGLKDSLPALFAKGGAVETARNRLLGVLGQAQSAQSQEFLGMPISQWSVLGNTLYEATQSFGNHTRELSGTQTEDKVLTLQTLYGNTVITNATVNLSSTTAVANLSKTAYPIVKIGDTVVFSNVQKTVVGKTYIATSEYVTCNVAESNTTIYAANTQLFNFLDYTLGSGTIKIQPGMYLKVNGEIKQIETVDESGEFVTVTAPVRNSFANLELNIESGFVVNSAFASTATDQLVRIKSELVANSLCLSNVITGNGTTFTSALSVGDKVYYDEREFFVLAVTDTSITVDDTLLATPEPRRIYKVTKETAVMRVVESNSPDDILAMFDGLDQLSTNYDAPLTEGLTTRYRKSDGTYATVDSSTPVSVTQSLQKPELVNAVTRTLQKLLDEFQNEAIQALSDSEIVNYLEEITDELDEKRKELLDSIEQDLAAINAVKGLLKGLLKLFQASCSKKKKGDDPENPDDSSDQYLRLILTPNPTRQGCDATVSDLPELLDAADAEYKTFPVPEVDTDLDPPPQLDVESDFGDVDYAYRPQTPAGGDGDIGVDGDPNLGPRPVDPCTQPC